LPSPLAGEGLPYGVSFSTPQGKGEGEELRNSFRLFIPLPFTLYHMVQGSSPPARGGELCPIQIFDSYRVKENDEIVI